MGSISLQNISITSGVPLFRDLTLVIQDGDRVGLVAGNGNGKTSLLRCIAGEVEPSAGAIVRSRGLKVGYVEQDIPEALRKLSLRDAVCEALPPGRAYSRSSNSRAVDMRWRIGGRTLASLAMACRPASIAIRRTG